MKESNDESVFRMLGHTKKMYVRGLVKGANLEKVGLIQIMFSKRCHGWWVGVNEGKYFKLKPKGEPLNLRWSSLQLFIFSFPCSSFLSVYMR